MTVIMRTQGRRKQMLSEALLCLMAQSDSDFEVVLCVHTDDSPVTALVERLVATFPQSFATRVRVLEVRGGSRGTPLNRGLDAARGAYVAFLDDDDLVTADWVEAFHTRAALAPGRILRSVTGTQAIAAAEHGEYVTTGRIEQPYPIKYDAVQHLYSNSTPICSFAVPTLSLQYLGTRFDEALPVLEDWDFLLRAANWCGVADTERITSIYHLWTHGEASSAAEPPEVWALSRRSVHAKLADRILVLPRGSVAGIVDARHRGRSEHLDLEIARLQGETGQQFAEIQWLRKHGLRGVIRDLKHMILHRKGRSSKQGSKK